jgi:hypothetical protein
VNEENAVGGQEDLSTKDLYGGFRTAIDRVGSASQRLMETASHAFALAELLVSKGIIGMDELSHRQHQVQERLQSAYRESGLTVQISSEVTDKYAVTPADIDCHARLPLCQAACCRLRFPLTPQDVEEGVVQWTLTEPYLNRQTPDGYCVHCDGASRHCLVYERRPGVCRTYDCRKDHRIWLDFENRVINPDCVPAPNAKAASEPGNLTGAALPDHLN